MKILYISVHSILEFDELSLFTELGHDCFSLGAYTDPRGHLSLPRPGIPNMPVHEDLIAMSLNMPRTELTTEFLDRFDCVMIMDGYHAPEVIRRNWDKLKTKKVIWRTIGQSLPEVEAMMTKLKKEGLKIVRYSPKERDLENYAGEDAVIRFYKDPEEFKNWNGYTNQVINFSQSLKGRRDFCGYDTVMDVAPGFSLKVYGSGNENLGEWNGGELSYEALKGAMRDCKVYLYAGTWPASYTLSFIEAFMTGIPIVATNLDLWKHKHHPQIKLYEVPEIIQQGDEGFYAGSVEEIKEKITRLLNDRGLSENISKRARAKAIKLFGKEGVRKLWQDFFGSL